MLRPISIITAIHNGLPMNRLYWKALSKNTSAPFELVIVDNHSTDGSEALFRELSQGTGSDTQKVVYVRNEHNQSYPASQLQGMAAASHDILAFFNNDIWMPFGWEKPILRELEKDPRVILSPSGQDAQPTQTHSDRLKRRWIIARRLSKAWAWLLRKSEEERLWKSLEWMYGDLENFRSPTPQLKPSMDGIKGDSVVLHRSVVSELGGIWDLQLQAADWHLYLKAAAHAEKHPGFPLPQVLLDTYTHHFGRYSIAQDYEPLPAGTSFRSIDEVWGRETVRRLWWGYHLPQN
jgi:GT2 family glycosyltransferase